MRYRPYSELEPKPVPTLWTVVRRAGTILLVGLLIVSLVGLAGCAQVAEMAAPEAYRAAQDFVRTNQAVRDEIGDVQSFSPVPTNVSVDPLAQSAVLDFSVTGTKGEATVHVESALEGEQWVIRSASMTGPSGARVALSTPSATPAKN